MQNSELTRKWITNMNTTQKTYICSIWNS